MLALAASPLPVRAAAFDVAAYGAKPDGTTLNTAAIQQAIDAAAKAGGGVVVFQPGVYLSGALFLKSGTELRLDEGVEIRGVQDLAAYPVMQTRVAGIEMPWPSALINVYRQAHVKIGGKGSIDGDGKIWWDKYWKMRREDYEPIGLRWAADYDCRRPRLIQVYDSADVEVRGLTLKRSGFWTVHICYSRRVTVDGVTIRNNIGGRGPSTDGVDIDSSSDVLVAHCDIECNDDAICLKAGRDADGLRVNRTTEKIRIYDNTVRGGAAGVTIGSETSGGIRDVDVRGLTVLSPVPAGILFKSASTRGGTIENITIANVTTVGVATPVSISLNWNPSYSYAKMPEGDSPALPAGMKEMPDYWKVLTSVVPPDKGMPHFRHIRISGLKSTGAQRAFAVSSYADSPLVDFTFRDIEIEAKTAGTIANAQGWKMENVRVKTSDGTIPQVK
jgi:polygalacturonase